MPERDIYFGADATDAQFRTGDDPAEDRFVVAEDTDSGTILLEWDDAVGEWVSRGPVNMSGNDVTNVGALDATSITTDKIDTVDGFISGLVLSRESISQISTTPGKCIASDDRTVIDASGSTLTADISTTGPGGRQSGLLEQSSEWYQVYVVADADGSNADLLLVAEQQTFSNPKDVSRRIGWIYNNSSSNIRDFSRVGADRVYWNATDTNAVDTSSPEATLTAFDVSNLVPPGADVVIMLGQSTGDGTSNNNSLQIGEISDSTYIRVQISGWAGNSSNDNATRPLFCPTGGTTERELYYKTQNASSALIRVLGYINER